ncbi:hypothetical protein [Mycolicibacterium palauense]|uniref:hypothetical protein n=1 Tax=Mycolicibacterium palauense TaxID=2034511 RepID=UPI000BFECFA2|nr:hypothetical protein [Mycolicibacterium palauense]
MRPRIGPHVPAVVIAAVAATALAAPVRAEPAAQIPGNGVFRVGVDIEPGTYRSQGPSTPLILVFGDVSPISFCSWSTHSTPAAGDGDLVDANSSLGPVYATVPATVVAFRTANCQPWTRVS